MVFVGVTDRRPPARPSPIWRATARFSTETYEGVEISVSADTAYALLDGMLVVANRRRAAPP